MDRQEAIDTLAGIAGSTTDILAKTNGLKEEMPIQNSDAFDHVVAAAELLAMAHDRLMAAQRCLNGI